MTDADPAEEVEGLRDQLSEGDRGGCEEDRELLLRASDRIALVPSEVGDHRHLKILRHATRMSEEPDVELVDAVEDRSAAETVVRWIHRTYENEHTNQDYRTCLRTIGRFAAHGDEVPEALAWIPTGTSNDFDPVPSERDLLTEEEMRDLVDACRNPRDAALIAVQFEAGLRGGELYDLAVGDVFDAEHTTGIHGDGKEGERPVHLRISLPFLQRWLDEHPAREDDEAPLWSKLGTAERPSYTTFLNYFKNAADRAGISKAVTPTNLRKSNTRWLVLQGFETPRIEDRQGRERGSDHTQRYLAAFGSESNEVAYLSALGEDVGDDAPEQAGLPVECPRCGRETPRDRAFCMWCDFALTPDATEGLESTRNETVDRMVDADSREAREWFASFLSYLEANPHELPDDVHERLPSEAPSSSSPSN